MNHIVRKRLFTVLILICGLWTSQRPRCEESERFVVKISSGKSKDPNTRARVRAANLENLQNELFDNVEGVEETTALKKVGVLLVEGDRDSIVEALKDNPQVEFFEKDIQWKISEFTELGSNQIPGDSSALPSAQSKNSWLSSISGLTATAPDYDVPVPSGPGAPTPVTVAVVDSGSNYNHPYLASAIASNSGEIAGDGLDNDHNGYVDDVYGANVISGDGDVASDSSHGTHVAGLIKTVRDQAIGMGYTSADRVRVLPVKFISGGSGSTSNAIAALNYAAARGASVINCSWGAGGKTAFSQALYDTMIGLYNSDIVISVAAGNSATNNDVTPYFPAGYNIPSLLSVGSIDGSGGLSYFSNFGSNSVDVTAVGSMSSGNGVWSADSNYQTSGSYWVRMKGTSMAAPLVAGVAGVIRALNSTLTNYEVKNRIVDTGISGSESSSTKSGRRIKGAAAFSGAASLVSTGARPAISGPAYFGQSASGNNTTASTESSKGRIGGCGLIAPVAGAGAPPEGPLGGNSIGLFTLAYCLYLMSKKLFKNRHGEQT